MKETALSSLEIIQVFNQEEHLRFASQVKRLGDGWDGLLKLGLGLPTNWKPVANDPCSIVFP